MTDVGARRGPEVPCARRILERIATQAYRRPVSSSELETLMTFYVAGRSDGSVAIWRTTPPPRATATTTEWPALVAELRGLTTACLSNADRQRLFGEDAEAAAHASSTCARSYGFKTLRLATAR